MTCSDTRKQLTAYLDGELDADRGTVVRGHLRTCEACRDIAEREAVLRDSLRALEPVDPPPSLWANVQAKLADAEVAEAQRPAWRRALARWMRVASPPRLALAGTALVAAFVLVWWRHTPAPENKVIWIPPVVIQHGQQVVKVEPLCKSIVPTPPAADMTADIEGEADRVTTMYCAEAESQLRAAAAAPLSADQRKAFDARVAELRGRIDKAGDARTAHKALRELIKFTAQSVARDNVALAEVGP